jgi:hypothetical protein
MRGYRERGYRANETATRRSRRAGTTEDRSPNTRGTIEVTFTADDGKRLTCISWSARAGSFEDLPGKWQAAILEGEQNRPRIRLVRTN